MGVGSYPVLDLPFIPDAATTEFRFQKLGATDQGCTLAGADEVVLGVALETTSAADATAGRVIGVRVLGVSVVEAAGAISIGAPVYSDAAGKATGTGTTNPAGTALTATTADGQYVMVLLVPKV